jgi:hypothetical protein
MIGGVAVLGTERYSDSEATLAQACTGALTHSRLDYTLFNLRAQTNGGEDTICEPTTQLDEDSALTQRTARLERRLLHKGR